MQIGSTEWRIELIDNLCLLWEECLKRPIPGYLVLITWARSVGLISMDELHRIDLDYKFRDLSFESVETALKGYWS